MLARCTSSLDLHMLIVPYWYLFRTLLVPKVALVPIVSHSKKLFSGRADVYLAAVVRLSGVPYASLDGK